MARVSRKKPQTTNETAPIVMRYKTAGYARLSIEDKDTDGGSLDNQMLMISNYINETPDLELCSFHSDNGQTGTNFDRSGFENLMEEIRQGKINCIVVKDLSRFGRDYVEAGNFLEVIFPRLGVRFISINDHYDSFDPRCQGDGLAIALKNMINSFYSKDISAKMRAAHATRQRNGEYVSAKPTFGYAKSPDKRGKLIVDEEAAEIVRQIFRLKLDGLPVHQISAWLNERNVPTPGHYRYIKGIFCDKRYAKPQYWNDTTVIKILQGTQYLGHLSLGKTKAKSHKLYDRVIQPKEDWIITENAHEALVSQSDFDKVQELLNETHRRISERQYKKWDNPENIFKGLAFCAECGHVFGRRRISSPTGHTSYSYTCASCKKGSDNKKSRPYLKQTVFYDVIFKALRQQIDICADARQVIERIHMKQTGKQHKSRLETEIKRIQGRLSRIPALRIKLYEDFCDGIIDEADYQLLGNQNETEKVELIAQLEQLSTEKSKYQPEFVDTNKWVTALEQFKDSEILTRDMLLALVERIEVKGDLSVHIIFRYQDEYQKLYTFITESEGQSNE